MIRRVARLLLGAAFVSSGVEALRDVDRRAARARDYGLSDPVTASRAVAGLQIAAGAMLGLNRLPRLSALMLALTVVPDAATAHDFWSEKDDDAKRSQRSLFARDTGLLGGLLVAVADTGGRESVSHRAKRVSRRAARTARRAS
ncbi:MAG TPA: DoxX family membrane protein [Mycobacteriales bacterium]|nr:DoxX family membrane protein [Mycobacteriales bacterium]